MKSCAFACARAHAHAHAHATCASIGMAAPAEKRRRLTYWERGDVTYCKCSSLSYCHTHCPCEDCEGKAISRATEYRYWKKARTIFLSENRGGNDACIEQIESTHGDGTNDTEERKNDVLYVDEIETDTSIKAVAQNRSSPERSPTPVDDQQIDAPAPLLDSSTASDIKQVVIQAVLNAMSLNDEVNGSQQNFMSILEYGKNLSCKGANNFSLKEYWPSSWQSSVRLLKDNGYKDPKELFTCLSDDHPCSYDIMDSPTTQCRYCNASESTYIKYAYLPLKDKIERWCSDPTFFHKMTAHWVDREHWLENMTIDEDRSQKSLG